MKVTTFFAKHASPILTGVGISLDISCAITTGEAMIKARRIIDAKAQEKGSKLTKEEMVRETWKLFLLPISLGALGAGCHIGSNIASHKKQMALMGIATASETAYTKLKDQLPELAGPRKSKQIRESQLQSMAEDDYPQTEEIEMARRRSTPNAAAQLFYMPYTGRWLRTNTDDLIRSQNEVNTKILSEGSACFADLEYSLGAKPSKMGELLEWRADMGEQLEIGWVGSREPFIHQDGSEESYFIVDITPEPKLGYMDVYA